MCFLSGQRDCVAGSQRSQELEQDEMLEENGTSWAGFPLAAVVVVAIGESGRSSVRDGADSIHLSTIDECGSKEVVCHFA